MYLFALIELLCTSGERRCHRRCIGYASRASLLHRQGSQHQLDIFGAALGCSTPEMVHNQVRTGCCTSQKQTRVWGCYGAVKVP